MDDNQNSLDIEASAKINLALAVKHKRKDGYHEIESIFQEIDFSDSVSIVRSDRLSFHTDSPQLSSIQDNLCLKAARLMQNKYQIPGLSIYLKKKIPIAAGLGGGSSNAAAILHGINQLYHLGVTADDLFSMAGQLGADVPFFIRGGTAYVSGVGERLHKIEIYSDYVVLLILPQIRISTTWAYKNLKLGLTRDRGNFKFRGFRFRGLDLHQFKSEFFNDFEKLVFRHYPLLLQIKNSLREAGAVYASLSGSGSAIYGLFDSLQNARRASEKFRETYNCQLTQPLVR